MDKITVGQVYKVFLNLGVVLLAIGITFSISLMSIAIGFLFIAFLILLFGKKLKFYPTGLELPLAIFIGFYILSAVIGSDPLHSINKIRSDYWYILLFYFMIFLFNEKEINRFVKVLGWATVVVSVLFVSLSVIGPALGDGFQLAGILDIRFEKMAEVMGISIYRAKGILGHHLTFGGQIMMLTFFSYAAFKRKWVIALVSVALLFSFAYSAWLGYVAAAVFFLSYFKKKYIAALIILLLFFVLLLSVPGNMRRVTDKFADRVNIWKVSLSMVKGNLLLGIGAGNYTEIFDKEYSDKFIGAVGGARTHPHSIYITVLTDGGILTFAAFIFFWIKFFYLYLKPPENKYKILHIVSILSITGILFAGIFQNYLSDAENAVVIWILIGIIVKIKKEMVPNFEKD